MRFIIVMVLAFGLAACGKKPANVDPPQGEEADNFPRTYPME